MPHQCEWTGIEWIRLPAKGLDRVHDLAKNCGLPPLGDTNSPNKDQRMRHRNCLYNCFGYDGRYQTERSSIVF